MDPRSGKVETNKELQVRAKAKGRDIVGEWDGQLAGTQSWTSVKLDWLLCGLSADVR